MAPVEITSNFSTPLPTPLRSDINSALLTSGAITRIHDELLLSLQTSGWAEAVRQFALEQIRENGKTTYGGILDQVLMETRQKPDLVGDKGKKVLTNGDGNGKLRVPETVIDDGLNIVRKELEEIVEVVDG